ncbi:relaxase/mobilization nuclease domain-containing protein [Anaerotignum propionicum]|uniref:Relaxase/Mobilisation nuclease domain-containing protein n=1 Tax=Anaerotignum propionicum DSM 1682 TaxID=991789 RepID=A0A0X1U950_ANAPI|nr:relaxase/mobilization nuclease domain-containing protein [Anaerotignum propionicum]AMJ41448.1 relaxase/mobilization nuclease domain protein [Anaerotignum propionicum DSM 1682]SHE68683.1 Relaxase/Mobilisation nuclease domain-containing protein [[Clostridium] propionicum DSM 1682] [Anaerotignum propionicum DSM 1682]
MHINKGKTLTQCLADRTDYAKNPDKTNSGELVSSFMCDADLVDSQFLLSKQIYLQKTGRIQKNDVIAYQLRQSFKPGEISPELANQIGYQLAEKVTKGNHAFIVATHIDKSHIHNHIIWNSTNLNCKKKFRNFWNSTKAIQKTNDLLCLQNGLSIIENPRGKSKNYGSWLEEEKPLNFSDKLRLAIDEVLAEKPENLDEFFSKMKSKGFEIKTGINLAFKGAGQRKFIRLRSLGKSYQENNLREVIEGKKEHKPQKRVRKYNDKKVNLVIDLQSKISQKKGAGYERWAKTFNLKQLAKTMNYLTENNLLNYEDLRAKAEVIINEFSRVSDSLKSAEKQMAEISILQKNIIDFAKTKAVYEDYKKSGYSSKFKEENITEILLHQAAKNYFKEVGLSKLPKMADLKIEYATLFTEKKKAYSKYNSLKKEMQEILNAKANVEQLLEFDEKEEHQQKKKAEQSL